MTQQATNKLKLGAVGLTLIAVGSLGIWGWSWLMKMSCQEVKVTGENYADRDEIMKLAAVDTGMVLFKIDPDLVSDRVRRHPWIREAQVRRLATGILTIHVLERHPVVLVLGRNHRAEWYLDANGYPLGILPDRGFDVPVLRGLDENLHPIRPVENVNVRLLLESLTMADADTDALISEVEIRRGGDVWLTTVPYGIHGTIEVRLGSGDYTRKLERLNTFWYQAVLAKKDKKIDRIDLRFNSQIVTTEIALVERTL